MKLNKAQMHQRPTYETLVKDTILEPKDKIALPDRQATILRKTQQLSRYDDAEFLDLEKDNGKIKKSKHNRQPLTQKRETIRAEALRKNGQHNQDLIEGTILRNHHPHHPHREECLVHAWEADKGKYHMHHYKHKRLAADPHYHQQTEPK